MAQAYVRERQIPYSPGQTSAFKVSRSKIELFMQCQRCFYLDVRYKITRPTTAPFSLNNAVDSLFKKEFDGYRTMQKPHPLMTKHKIAAVPFNHPNLSEWRENFIGVTAVHAPTNLHIFGAVDDIWVQPEGSLLVVDYKATAKPSKVSLDADWQISYKRQMEVYQWLLRQNGFTVSDTGYFVYTNGKLDADGFLDRLEFETVVLAYTGSDTWVEPTIFQMKDCMDKETLPAVGRDIMGGPCQYCMYAKSRTELTLKHLSKTQG